MLQRIGDALKGQKWLAYLVLGALAVVFAAWGAYGVVNLSFGGSNYAAEANGSKISLEEAREAWLRQQTQWQQRLGGAEIPAPLRGKLQDQVLEGLIGRALLTQRTHDMGYRVSQDALREAVHSEQAFQVAGQYSPEAAKAALAQAGISLQTYEQDLRTQVQRVQLEGGIRASDFLTPLELTRLTDLEEQEREVRYLVLPLERFKSAAGVDEAAVQAYYQAHQAQYMTSESAHLQYAELRLEALAAQQSVSDADLHTAYEKSRSRLEVPEKRHARPRTTPRHWRRRSRCSPRRRRARTLATSRSSIPRTRARRKTAGISGGPNAAALSRRLRMRSTACMWARSRGR